MKSSDRRTFVFIKSVVVSDNMGARLLETRSVLYE